MGMPQKIRCLVERIIDHGDKVYTLVFRPERLVPTFLPGQFLHLAIDEYEPGDFWPESRVFSIASSPAEKTSLSIIYSVVGSFTSRMEQKIREGSTVWVKLPYGEFIIQNTSSIALIAGGTGITAFTAFLSGLTPENGQNVSLFYGARNPDLLIFRSLLEQKTREVKNLSVWYFAEEGISDQQDGMIKGRFSMEKILPVLQVPSSIDFYLSGPPAMLKKISLDLQSHSIDPAKIKIDAWA